MIGKLSGRLDETGEDWAMVDCGGVGYVATCSARTLRRLPAPGEAVALVVETVMREDSIRLFGFLDKAERDWFRVLQTVQGVGAKVALAILDTLAPDELTRAVTLGDKAALGRASGVGPKLALRLVTELKDRVPAGAGTGFVAAGPAPSDAKPAGGTGPVAEAVSALVNLGYKPVEASVAVTAALSKLGPAPELGALIRGGLKELAK
ncbi:Holliday junction branch migration protein RuvA [Zavarzinia compransoris]|uniref:Holliday junction branch migration complex subunit RuvA n=1 Tax=Zavarzinia compransoris TaxID=1264899 RepID=A0A317E0X9_9PROT|nr:Holliday junction branch migration protein RuvA [Zavarzinia compransoris]PWR20737.1 Holliday junction branch migration protein RuvA [Zavarzinia compransoris]TDP44430.1 Holliday junction DNA helicase subunit RuvA [Zavarzinia compransoris]